MSSPRRLIPVACPRPSSSMPKQRVSSIVPYLGGHLFAAGVNPRTSFTSIAGLTSPVRKRDRRNTG